MQNFKKKHLNSGTKEINNSAWEEKNQMKNKTSQKESLWLSVTKISKVII